MKQTFHFFLYLIFGLATIQTSAQSYFSQRLDSSSMLIGDQRRLILTSSTKEIGEMPFSIIDTMSWFHIVDKGNWNQSNQNFERQIVFTVFDSGYFVIPSLGMIQNGDSIKRTGNPLSLEVNYPSDSLNILRPIKAIEETKTAFKYFYAIILGLLFIAGMLFVLWQMFKADRIKPAYIELSQDKKVWEQCIQLLHDLDEKKLWQNGKIKEYYDELNHILRIYLSNGLKIPALENTSSEIIDFIQHQKPEIANWEMLRLCFTESDLVKFANMNPEPEKNKKWLAFAESFISSNKELSDMILEETRVHWHALLGESISQQFENPFETVPVELIRLYDSAKFGKLELLHNLIYKSEFQLPESWIGWHEMHTGSFYRWQFNMLNISGNRITQALLLLFILPFITIFLPVLIVMNFWKKEDLFSRGIFALSSNNKLLIRKIK